MTFFYDLNKKLAGISEQPAGKQQVNEGLGELSRSIAGAAKKIGPVAKKVGGAVQKAGSAALNTLGHGNDADMIRDLQRKMGMPQTGMKPASKYNTDPIPKDAVYDPFHPDDKYDAANAASKQQVKEKMSPGKAKSFAALAEPKDKITLKDKITFADKIAGAKKEVDEVLGDVAAEAMKSALSGGQKKLDKNKNGKLDANDFAMLRNGGKQKTAEASGAIDFDKVLDAIAALYGDDIWDNDAMQDLANDLEQAGPTDRELDFIIAKGKLPKRLAGIQFSAGDGVKFDEGWDDMVKDVHSRAGQMKTGEKIQGHKGEIEKTATGIRHTRRYDNKTGETDTGDETTAGEKRGRGRPKSASKAPERVTANATKHKGGRKVAKEGDFGPMEDKGDLKAAAALLKKAGYKITKVSAEQELDEKAVSKKQQKFMGMVHATQKGEKAPSKEVAKVANTMKKSDAKDFASTKQKGLPEKAPKKKEEGSKEDKPKKVKEEGGAGTPTASSGFSFGQGIYDSMNFELEQMIAESMSINMSDSSEGGKSLTVTATDDDALQLADLLNNAGMQGGNGMGQEMGMDHEAGACPSCGSAPCGCDDSEGEVAVDENKPNWPTDTEQAQNNFGYSGGLNKPKTDVAGDGQTTVPVTAVHSDEEEILRKLREAAGITKVAEQEQVVAIEDEKELEESFEQTLDRMRGIAGIKEAKKAKVDYDEDGKIETGAEEHAGSVDKAIKKAQAEKKVDESIFALTNQWKAYKG